jgi:hypothetical protein
MTSLIFYLTQGPRIFLTSWKNRFFPKKFKGDAKEICKTIVKNCWNGRFFQTSATNFPQFWARDFGWCTKSLIELKYTKEIHKTLRYALNLFRQKGEITTTITPQNTPFDFPTFAVDSLPWLIHSIVVSNFDYKPYKDFLNKEIKQFKKKVIDEKTNLVTTQEHFSSMKDFSIRLSSCYDNCMVAMLSLDLHKTTLSNPFAKKNQAQTKAYYSDLIYSHFWQGEYFYDDLEKKEYIAGDAQVFPLILGLIEDEKEIKTMIQKVHDNNLTSPLPLRYTKNRNDAKFILQELFFFYNYEGDTSWTHMGPLWIKAIEKYNPELAKEYTNNYTKHIEKEKAFCEVVTTTGKPFSTPFYYCDRTMLWAANYLTLLK